jgi:hypothetical protein
VDRLWRDAGAEERVSVLGGGPTDAETSGHCAGGVGGGRRARDLSAGRFWSLEAKGSDDEASRRARRWRAAKECLRTRDGERGGCTGRRSSADERRATQRPPPA